MSRSGDVSPAGDTTAAPQRSGVLRTDDLDYHLPEGSIGLHPAQPRESARLLVAHRSDPGSLEHRHIRDLPDLLRPGDLLVVNTSRVIPARLLGHRSDTHGHAEGLYLGPAAPDAPAGATAAQASAPPGASAWRVMLKARRLRPGLAIVLHDRAGRSTELALRLIDRSPDEGEQGAWLCRLEGGEAGALDVLERVGHTPLPPYIRAARKKTRERPDEEADRRDYQTVYAGQGQSGSVAAPTAGLHFTPELLARLESRGIGRAEVVLHVGTGTFKTIETEFVEQHPMHAEWCVLPGETARAIVRTRAAGGRVIAVGTTSARVLESFGPAADLPEAGASGWSRLLITPGRPWLNVDGLTTNFHLPRSTLLALVGAMFPEGVPRLLAIYGEAIERGYRFYSFGDAMLVV